MQRMNKNIQNDVSLYFFLKDLISIKYYILFFSILFFVISFIYILNTEEKKRNLFSVQATNQFSLSNLEYLTDNFPAANIP